MELFYCYAYGRLSKEDGDKIESDSIKNQRDLIHSYIGQHPELKLVMEGYDDGYTGTNFERPCFKEMLEAVKEQKVNCVIVRISPVSAVSTLRRAGILKNCSQPWACALSPSTTVMIPPIWTPPAA